MAGTITSTKSTGKGRGIVRITANVLCDAAGVATATVVGEAVGRLVAVGYDPVGSGAAFDTNGDLTISDADTGAALVTLTDVGTSGRWFRPSALATLNTGVALTPGATIVDAYRDIYVGGKIKVAAAQGGNLGTCRVILVVDEAGL
jgi:hypothetical protein